MPVIFARTRYDYQSYSDFWKLVELSGFPVCYVDQIDLDAPSDTVYVTTPVNGELRPHIEYRRGQLTRKQKCKVVWWNLERPDSGDYRLPSLVGSQVANVVDEITNYVDRVWVSDRYYASLDSRLMHVVLGSHAGLRGTPEYPRGTYSYCHMSYITDRRISIYSTLRNRGMSEGPNAWGEERSKVLDQSRTMLNVHQTPALIGEPIRFSIAAAYKLPLVTETLLDSWPLSSGVDLLQAHYNDLANLLSAALVSNGLSDIGENLHKKLCLEWTFRRGVEEGVARTLA